MPGGVESAHQEHHQPLRQDGEREQQERGRDEARIHPGKSARPQNNPHDLRPQNNEKNRGRQRPKNNVPKRQRKMLQKFISPVSDERDGKRRENAHRVGKANHRERNRLKVLREIENRDRPRAERGPERGYHGEHELVQRKPERARQGKLQRRDYLPGNFRETGPKRKSERKNGGELDPKMQCRAQNHAPDDAGKPKNRFPEQNSENYSEIVKQRRKRVDVKAPERLHHGGNQAG